MPSICFSTKFKELLKLLPIFFLNFLVSCWIQLDFNLWCENSICKSVLRQTCFKMQNNNHTRSSNYSGKFLWPLWKPRFLPSDESGGRFCGLNVSIDNKHFFESIYRFLKSLLILKPLQKIGFHNSQRDINVCTTFRQK